VVAISPQIMVTQVAISNAI